MERQRALLDFYRHSPKKNFKLVVDNSVKTSLKQPIQFIDLEKSLLKEQIDTFGVNNLIWNVEDRLTKNNVKESRQQKLGSPSSKIS
mmetsp:Transcript_8226/g.7639  ORF Transcript_8226/g.7639 Transcript_8226/m.7639 type:complete len:87 (+) Transcript_8226:329-589(+)